MMPRWASAGFVELGDMIGLGLGDQVLFCVVSDWNRFLKVT